VSYQALYRKYRPLTFSDVVGQEQVTKTLQKELTDGKTVHAYLFTGTRGTGKTSCAKILARAVNCQHPVNGDPCLECEQCKASLLDENTDIVEIDAASNNGVDSIRELRELINFAPANSKYRVYIIDEVHMLSSGAFNALLKTLEEPPAHVIFILATTEVHKLPATILSRCQRFDFRRIDSEKIAERIQYVAEKEGLTVTDDAATLIASVADGGMRDALSILDLCASNNKNIDENTVETVCAMAGNDYLIDLTDCLKGGDTEKALILIEELNNSSVDMLRLLSELTSHFRDLMIVKTVKGAKKPIVCSSKRMAALENQAEDFDIKEIICCLNILQETASKMQSGNRRSQMELAVIKICNPTLSTDLDSLERRVAALEKGNNVRIVSAAQPENKSASKKTELIDDEIPLPDSEYETPAPMEEKAPVPQENVKSTPPEKGVSEVENWNEIIRLIKQKSPIMGGVLNDSKAYIKGDYLLIDAPNEQFRSLVNGANPIYKNSIRSAAQEVLGVTYKLGPYKKPTVSTDGDPLLAVAEKLKKFEIN
jgi:DNA polymerase-3 subunit gamma/tau